MPQISVDDSGPVEVLGDDTDTLSTGTGYLKNAGSDTVYVGTDPEVTAPGDEVQVITLSGSPAGGTFTVSFDGEGPSDPIAFDADGAAVTTGLETLDNVGSGDIVATGSAGGPWTLTFGGVYAETPVEQVTCDSGGLTGGTDPAATPTTTTEGTVAGYPVAADAELGPFALSAGAKLYGVCAAGEAATIHSLSIGV